METPQKRLLKLALCLLSAPVDTDYWNHKQLFDYLTIYNLGSFVAHVDGVPPIRFLIDRTPGQRIVAHESHKILLEKAKIISYYNPITDKMTPIHDDVVHCLNHIVSLTDRDSGYPMAAIYRSVLAYRKWILDMSWNDANNERSYVDEIVKSGRFRTKLIHHWDGRTSGSMTFVEPETADLLSTQGWIELFLVLHMYTKVHMRKFLTELAHCEICNTYWFTRKVTPTYCSKRCENRAKELEPGDDRPLWKRQ